MPKGVYKHKSGWRRKSPQYTPPPPDPNLLSKSLQHVNSRLSFRPENIKPDRENKNYSPDEIDQQVVATMAGYGIPQPAIAAILHISVEAMVKYYGRELATAATIRNAEVAHGLYQQALAGNVLAQMFWLKCRAGWKPQSELSIALPAAGPTRCDYSRLNDEELRQLMALTRKASVQAIEVQVETEQ